MAQDKIRIECLADKEMLTLLTRIGATNIVNEKETVKATLPKGWDLELLQSHINISKGYQKK